MTAQPTGKTFAEENGSQTLSHEPIHQNQKCEHAESLQNPLERLGHPPPDEKAVDGKRKETDHPPTHLWNKRLRSDSSVKYWIRHNYRWPKQSLECNLISDPQRAKYKDRSFDRSSSVHWGAHKGR
ncbi:hypothetical protein PAAG_08665 [Paracoccidioides lutzii Pb01]|uniref:Uncharacterized protein n=1 Tax=Paracoccidioides lutzii (strain ATCC MYA-826 / Pb01) TaxID=502779 RepID=C1HD24_PARBA|nr:hypothetical protein PAAG_08665 [Paracoccidioides lutzii Pb01]EEH39396.2 hypothetical protein PAAG_08665 [Paracoccidioides lutzii Pb01]